MASWRLAGGLVALRDQINRLAPARDRSSDGTIGDPAHQQRRSDHNPDDKGVVRALDITNDPAHGVNAHAMARQIAASRDPRTKYVISDSQIAEAQNGFRWTAYHGINPHDKHFHVSVVQNDKIADKMDLWKVTLSPDAPSGPIPWPTVWEGNTGMTVEKVQELLGLSVDGVFGPATKAAVAAFQRRVGLDPDDGIVGPYTWEKLLHGVPAPPAAIRHDNIVATVFSSDEDKRRAAYGDWIGQDTRGLSLPYRFPGIRPRVRLSYRGVVAENVPILDVGPWNIRDAAYVLGRARPRVETEGIDDLGRAPKNKAGVDLSPALAKELGLNGMGTLDWWEFQQ